MKHDPELLNQFLSYLPTISSEDRELLDNLPLEFKVDVPYYAQENMHWSGAAVAQMLHAFHFQRTTNQEHIAEDAGLENWRLQNHETLKEDFVRYMARQNYVPSVYYPGRYVLKNFSTGVEGADFIASNFELVNDIGFKFFKALMVSTQAPVMVRIHFHTGMYPMTEEMARVLDTAGHALLIVGYNPEGFIVHDPWDRARWGGSHGGENSFITYEELAYRPTVNCCLGEVVSFMPFRAYIDYPRFAMHENRDIEIVLKIKLPGVQSITSDIYPITSLSANLKVAPSFRLSTSSVSSARGLPIHAGMRSECSWTLNTGAQTGSFPIVATVRATLNIPAFGWETNAVDEIVVLSATAERRLDIKRLDWLNRYGR